MPRACNICDDSNCMLNKCNYCRGLYCIEHMLPENHRCPGLSINDDVRDWAEYEEKFGGRGRTVKGTERIIRSSDTTTSKSFEGETKPTSAKREDVEKHESDYNEHGGRGGHRTHRKRQRLVDRQRLETPAHSRLRSIRSLVERGLRLLILFVVLIALAYGGAVFWESATSWAPNVTSDDGGLSQEEVERKVHEHVNAERRSAGVAPLDYDDMLSDVAAGHSEDMAEKGYFSHTSPKGETTGDRYSKAAYRCNIRTGDGALVTAGENIFHIKYKGMSKTADGVARSTVSSWMASPGHRENMLASHWKNEGIGATIIERDGYIHVYVTQNFC